MQVKMQMLLLLLLYNDVWWLLMPMLCCLYHKSCAGLHACTLEARSYVKQTRTVVVIDYVRLVFMLSQPFLTGQASKPPQHTSTAQLQGHCSCDSIGTMWNML
jgi:hypothetical protein